MLMMFEGLDVRSGEGDSQIGMCRNTYITPPNQYHFNIFSSSMSYVSWFSKFA